MARAAGEIAPSKPPADAQALSDSSAAIHRRRETPVQLIAMLMVAKDAVPPRLLVRLAVWLLEVQAAVYIVNVSRPVRACLKRGCLVNFQPMRFLHGRLCLALLGLWVYSCTVFPYMLVIL